MKILPGVFALLVCALSPGAAVGKSGEKREAATSISQQAALMKLAYDAARLANAAQYNQARTILAEVGGYTRYEYSERVTENNWLRSQTEELQLELPRMKRAWSRREASEETHQQIQAMFDGLADLISASQDVHDAIAVGDLEAANRAYVDLTDPAYNAVVGAAYTVASEADRAITLERLSAR
jgi:hypothetical protein